MVLPLDREFINHIIALLWSSCTRRQL